MSEPQRGRSLIGCAEHRLTDRGKAGFVTAVKAGLRAGNIDPPGRLAGMVQNNRGTRADTGFKIAFAPGKAAFPVLFCLKDNLVTILRCFWRNFLQRYRAKQV